MARAQSVVLSKEEKKAALAEIKAGIKEAKAIQKSNAAREKLAQKEHAAFMKQLGKDQATTLKHLTGLESKLAAMTATAA